MNYFHSGGYFAKHGVLAVQPGGSIFLGDDEELGAVGVGTGIGHGNASIEVFGTQLVDGGVDAGALLIEADRMGLERLHVTLLLHCFHDIKDLLLGVFARVHVGEDDLFPHLFGDVVIGDLAYNGVVDIVAFIVKGVAGAALAVVSAIIVSGVGAATLDHKVWDHSVEVDTIVKAFAGEGYKVVHGLGSDVWPEFEIDISVGG